MNGSLVNSAAIGGRPTSDRRVETVRVGAYTVPTEAPESDGTLKWEATTIVIVEVSSGSTTGLGYTYAAPAAAGVVTDTLSDVVTGCDPMATGAMWATMVHAIRNQGRPGVVSSAISAVDIALWDLKAKLLGLSVADTIGRTHDVVPVYGSGGFTSLSDAELAEQLGGWAAQGLRAVKMKVGRDGAADPHRADVARGAIGDDVELFVDANGAYTRKQAMQLADEFAGRGVRWFEEPVSSDDLSGLRLLRDRAPAGIDITAGEYGYDLPYFRNMLAAGAVDCLQADVTRCGGITAFLRVGALADAECIDVSSHCAPQVSAHACAGLWHLRHLEYFADHIRLEAMLFDGVLEPSDGALRPDPGRPGLGIEFKRSDAERFQVR
ncbi:MAG: enolase C-terminal domain-like protein [Ilumatobacteraceae bacterium]